jgi:hypothetical protein
VWATDPSIYGVIKITRNSRDFFILSGYSFEAFARGDRFQSGSIRKPNGLSETLWGLPGDLGRSWYSDNLSSFDTTWKAGDYVFNVRNAASVSSSATLTVMTGNQYPRLLSVTNVAEANYIDTRLPFTLKWPDPQLSSGDFIHLWIEVVGNNGVPIFQTSPIPNSPGAISPTARSFVIPAGSLPQGEALSCFVASWNIVDQAFSISGAVGLSAFVSENRSGIQTRWNDLDVSYFNVAKNSHYIQTSTSAPVLRSESESQAEISSTLKLAPGGAIKSVALQPPGGGATSTLTLSNGLYRWAKTFSNRSQMDLAFTNGGFRLLMDTVHNGSPNGSLFLSGDSYPAAPSISNYTATQSVNSAEPFTLALTIPGGTAAEFVRVRVKDGSQIIRSSPELPTDAAALNGLATTFVIPSNTLTPGKRYDVEIHRYFITRTSNAYIGAIGHAGYASTTHLELLTTGGALTEPKLHLIQRIGDQTELQFDATAQRRYKIFTTRDFSNWTVALETNAASTTLKLRLPPSSDPTAFYKIGVGF